ncbi:major facilitator superfamily-domain-containing protein [Aspergillus cavernicola]|uniref:Major facilitator superfamily-domain-containing protein n=1 Tax=Aspergillus cavernicola TaxID=176166 RepID=A0ABR4I4J9_9EURO
MDPDEDHCLTGYKLYSILSGIMIATILISLDVSIIATAIPAITSQFNSATDIGWYGAAYPLTMCALQPLSGRISTIFSLRWSYLVFFAIFLLGSLLCGAAHSSTMFIVGRAVAGIGGAGVVSGGLSVIALVTPTTQRPLFTGLITSLYAVGTVIAPIIGGAFTSNVSWRWCFYINLPTGAVTLGALLFFFHPPQSTVAVQQKSAIQKIMLLDLVGCALFVPSIVMVFLALHWGGGEYAWQSATIIGLLVGFAVSMLLFILWEMRKGEAAMIPFTLLNDRSVVLSIIFGFLFVGSFVVPVYYLPEWFQIVKDASPMRSGTMLLPLSLYASLRGYFLWSKHVRYYNPWFFIGSTMLYIASGLYTTLTPFSSSSKWIGFQILQGLGCGFAAQMTLLTVQDVLKTRPAIIPVGISTVLFAQYFGSSVMQSVGASIFHNKLVDGLESGAGLNATGVTMLLDAGNLNVKQTALKAFPDRVDAVITAYNDAITTVFYLAVAASALAFVLSTGIKWTNINQAGPSETTDKQPQSEP